jgi:CubicO group peptidase (beta-lactamase class C family)
MTPDELGGRLAALLERHHVPGAAVGVLHRGEVTTAAAGVVNLDTGVEATPDTVFQIGSQGKMWTATVLMQLVDEGRVDLDVPVRTYLPTFAVADQHVSENVTLRHLLSHTSGIDGDNFADFGRGDDCLERYVESCAALEQTHPLGATMSYCNTGFTIIGRVIEVVTGKVWDAAMRERLFEPLGLTHTGTLPEEALLHRAAVGHISPSPGAPPQVAPVWMLPRACGPMGLINSTVADVLTFARLHLGHGVANGGNRLVAESSIRAMHHAQVESPDPYTLGSHWGLGVILFDWDGHFVYGHDGATIGQSSRLRIVPDADLAIALVANGGDTQLVYQELFGDLLAELAGIAVPAPLRAPADPPDVDLTPLAGAYQRLSVRYDLEPDGGRLAGTVTLSGPLASIGGDPVTAVTLTPVDATTFLLEEPGDSGPPSPAVFYEFHDGVPSYLHNGARANPRV